MTTTRYSAEAEQAVVGALLFDAKCYDRIGHTLTPADFAEERHRLIFTQIVAMVLAAKPVDVITVYESLKDAGHAEDVGGVVYINELCQSVPGTANVKRYAEIVREKALQRQVLAKADEALSIAMEPGDVREKLDRITTGFLSIEKQTTSDEPSLAYEVALARTDYYTKLEAGDLPPGLATRLPTLDRNLGGGLKRGRLHVVAARPSIGKSSLSQQFANTLAKDGDSGLFFTLEMPKEELADRAIAHVGRVDLDVLTTGKFKDDDWGRVSEAVEEIAQYDLHYDEQPGATIADIRAKCRQKKKLDYIVVDYLQLMDGEGDNREQQISAISRGLKNLAKELDVAVVLLSQLNRRVEERPGREPIDADLRESGAVEQDADVIIFLYPLRELADGDHLVACKISKNRGGRKNVRFALHFDGARQRWTESTEPVETKTTHRGL
jgi:replicative DNA helicase